jgi:galactokinase
MSIATTLSQRFREAHGTQPGVFRAPARVNLIGEHTDYNAGFVMPAAVEMETHVAIAPAAGARITIHAAVYGETIDWDVNGIPERRGHWSDYVLGVIAALQRRGFTGTGANLMIDSEIPPGAGLSSSAALEVATALAWLSHARAALAPLDIALLCQRVENDFVGVRSGIMDQFTVCHGRRGHAILLDCRSLEAVYLPLPPEIRLLVCDTKTKHALAGGEYNRRREECELAVQALSQFLPGIRALRDVTPEQLAGSAAKLDKTIYRRARHVVEENARVLAAADALREGDLKRFGDLMLASHRSLQHNFEVSSAELDAMVEVCLPLDGIYGARMMGGGFGGCVIALADTEKVPDLSGAIKNAYHLQTGRACDIYMCQTADAASKVVAN